jgi:hypothetical protein
MNGGKIGLILHAINFVRENESRLKWEKILYFILIYFYKYKYLYCKTFQL